MSETRMANKATVVKMFASISRGDAAGFLEPLADDVRFTLQGTTRFSGLYRGKADFVARLLVPLGEILEGGIALDIDEIVADDAVVVVRSRGRAKTKTGLPYLNSYVHFFHFADGKIVEATEYMDTELVTRVLGR